MLKIQLHHIVFVLSLLLASCATMVNPNGGPRDTTPPVPLLYQPADGSMNLQQNKIVIHFDEYIVLDKLPQQLVVSPPMNKDPQVSVLGKKLIIELPDSLRTNTTYTIFFGDAVRSFREQLAVHNFSYVFSTGSVVDSLSLQGVAINAFDHSNYKDLLVMLYHANVDSAIYKQRPYYLCKVEKDGRYYLNNLAAGKYQIFALKDENRNYIYDQPKEQIAFVDSLVVPYYPEIYTNDTIDSIPDTDAIISQDINLFVFTPIPKTTKLLKDRVFPPHRILLTFNRPVNNFTLEALDFKKDKNWHQEVYGLQRDSITVFLKGVKQDTIHVALFDGDQALDTLQWVMVKKKRKVYTSNNWFGKRKNKPLTAKPKVAPIPKIAYRTNIGSLFPFFGTIKINFKVPLKAYKLNRLELYKAKDTLWIPQKFTAIMDDTLNKEQIQLFSNYEERHKYKLLIRDSSFFDIYNASNDSLEKTFITSEMRQYGSLKVEVNYDNKNPMIIQLLNEKGAVLFQDIIDSSQSIYYPYLTDGKYQLKAIRDSNNNGKWDTGNLDKHIQPERTYFVPQTIDIRANWDSEQKWLIE